MLSNPRVVVVTGSSSGIGNACALRLTADGYCVHRTIRQVPNLSERPSFDTIRLDLTESDSIHSAINQVIAKSGKIDALVNCAGYGLYGPALEIPMNAIRHQFETNLFGTWQVCQVVAPHLQRGGYIINIGSLGGCVGMPFQAAYSASKFALSGFTESMSMELRQFGINVVLIEPGNYSTSFTDNRKTHLAPNSPHREICEQVLAEQHRAEASGHNPADVADLVGLILKTSHPKMRYKTGPFHERIAVRLKSFVPGRIYERMVMRFNGMR